MVVDAGLGQPRLARELAHAGPRVAVCREEGRGGFQDRLPASLARHAGDARPPVDPRRPRARNLTGRSPSLEAYSRRPRGLSTAQRVVTWEWRRGSARG